MPPICKHLLATACVMYVVKAVTTNHQPPTTNHQLPAANHHPPPTNHQSRTTNQQPPAANHQQCAYVSEVAEVPRGGIAETSLIGRSYVTELDGRFDRHQRSGETVLAGVG